MKRSPMARGSGFARKTLDRPVLAFPAPIRRVAATLLHWAIVATPKQELVRSEAYRRVVAGLPCKICGVVGYSQAAHPNAGKGGGIKTDDRLCFALCCDRPGVQGCHPKFDQGALYSRPRRRVLEAQWSAETAATITAAGAWPVGLPLVAVVVGHS